MIATQRKDNYGYQHGRRYACECLTNISRCTPSMVMGILKNLEKLAETRPAAEGQGILDIVLMVKLLGVVQ